tara:strand:+ start:319 stop:750 length:432 start_codon:yes stop_codon:yes gene_type:complete
MSFLKHNSWGRTRQPKNIAGPHETQVTLVAEGSLDAVTDGYSTEGQRYLHILVGNGSANNLAAGPRTVTVYGYNHAFGKWFPLLSPSDKGEPPVAVTLTAPDNDGVEAMAGRKGQTFEIFGVDRVAFVGVTADTICFAACSTF